jgi:hypothetical protein
MIKWVTPWSELGCKHNVWTATSSEQYDTDTDPGSYCIECVDIPVTPGARQSVCQLLVWDHGHDRLMSVKGMPQMLGHRSNKSELGTARKREWSSNG